MMRATPTALAITLLAAAVPLEAQSVADLGATSSTKGFFIGANLNGSAISADELGEGTDSGAGLGLQLGYGFTPHFAFVVDGTGASINSEGGNYGLGHFDVALRYAFTGQTRRFVPFVEAGYSGRAARQDDVTLFFDDGSSTTGDLSISGAGFTFGGGLQYYVSPKLALGVGLKWTTGEFSTVKFDDVSVDGLELDATSTRFNVGMTWYPSGGR